MNRSAMVAIAVAALLGATQAAGQNVIEARLDGQPLVYLKDGQVNGCGVRLIIMDPPPNLQDSSLITGYDASFNIHHPGHGVVKVGAYEVRFSDMRAQKFNMRRPFTPAKFWFKAPGAPATSPNEKMKGLMVAGDDPGTALYITETIDPVIALFAALDVRAAILVGVTRQGAKTERIFSGSINVTDGERKQVQDCLSELTSRK